MNAMGSDEYRIINLHECPGLRCRAAEWFCRKWGIPMDEYLSSIDECIAGRGDIPQWYLVMADNEIIGGAGVIDNDFHKRRDLWPNVCALYVEEKCRNRGIAGRLLEHVCRDMAARHVMTLYLVTDHTAFYERYGWEFMCMVQGDDGNMIRMYRRASVPGKKL